MTEPKKPQDRKPKKDAGKTVTVRGVTVTVPPEALDDFELFDDLSEAQNGNSMRIVPAFKRLFGDDYKRILDELRGENGRVPITGVMPWLMDLFKALAPNAPRS